MPQHNMGGIAPPPPPGIGNFAPDMEIFQGPNFQGVLPDSAEDYFRRSRYDPNQPRGYGNIPDRNYRRGMAEGERRDYLADLLGDQAGFFGLGVGEGRVPRRRDLPWLETAENMRRQQQAQNMAFAGIGFLEDAYGNIGQSEPEQFLMQEAVRQAGDQSDLRQALYGNIEAMRSRGSVALNDVQNQLRAMDAQRGLGGGVPAMRQAEMGQQGRLGLISQQAQQMAGAEQQLDAARGAAMERLLGVTAFQTGRQDALGQLIADMYTGYEPAEFSLAALLPSVKHGGRPAFYT